MRIEKFIISIIVAKKNDNVNNLHGKISKKYMTKIDNFPQYIFYCSIR